ncbi:uncharacterized protein LOC133247108 isoform X2 [Bos javanicus]|uniref:uncharacterized protein LOC133247108 isoform X2 n=1 Tax=Bos javanicus TaxID=9906 RepID=UPI002AA80EA0|nr:uncharacterized protein LOC133247108 isoform X2 [Bos javanicus]
MLLAPRAGPRAPAIAKDRCTSEAHGGGPRWLPLPHGSEAAPGRRLSPLGARPRGVRIVNESRQVLQEPDFAQPLLRDPNTPIIRKSRGTSTQGTSTHASSTQLAMVDDQRGKAGSVHSKVSSYHGSLHRSHDGRLEIENAELQTTVKKQAARIEQLQKNLLSTRLSEDEKEQLKKYIELKQSLENSLDQEKKKNSELEKETTGFKKLLKMTRRKLNEYENGV